MGQRAGLAPQSKVMRSILRNTNMTQLNSGVEQRTNSACSIVITISCLNKFDEDYHMYILHVMNACPLPSNPGESIQFLYCWIFLCQVKATVRIGVREYCHGFSWRDTFGQLSLGEASALLVRAFWRHDRNRKPWQLQVCTPDARSSTRG